LPKVSPPKDPRRLSRNFYTIPQKYANFPKLDQIIRRYSFCDNKYRDRRDCQVSQKAGTFLPLFPTAPQRTATEKGPRLRNKRIVLDLDRYFTPGKPFGKALGLMIPLGHRIKAVLHGKRGRCSSEND
jgi:hypothetical protein